VFTGIVEEIGLVKEIIPGNKSIKLTIKCEKIMDDVKVGDSIAVTESVLRSRLLTTVPLRRTLCHRP